MLTVLIAAACAGVTSYAAAAQWIADLPGSVLSRIGIGPGRPAISTLRRLELAVDADLLDAVCSAWLAVRSAAESPSGRPRVIAVDGKSVRGAIRADGRCEHLLAAVDHRSGLSCITLVTTRGEGVEEALGVVWDVRRGGDLLSAEADRR